MVLTSILQLVNIDFPPPIVFRISLKYCILINFTIIDHNDKLFLKAPANIGTSKGLIGCIRFVLKPHFHHCIVIIIPIISKIKIMIASIFKARSSIIILCLNPDHL